MTPELAAQVKRIAEDTHRFVTDVLPALGNARMTYCPRCLMTLPPGPLLTYLPSCRDRRDEVDAPSGDS